MTFKQAYLISFGLAVIGLIGHIWILLAAATVLNAMIGFIKEMINEFISE